MLCEGEVEALQSLLIKPVQALPQAQMLFESLLKVADDGAEKTEVRRAWSVIKEAATHCQQLMVEKEAGASGTL